MATPEQLADFSQGRVISAAFLRLAQGCGSTIARPLRLAADQLRRLSSAQGALFPAGLYDPGAGEARPLPIAAIGEEWLFPICATAPPIRRGP